MKKISLLVLLTLSLALLLGGSAFAAEKYEEQSYEIKDPSAIHAIEITDTDVPIEIRPSGDGSMHVSYYTSEHEKYDVGVDNGTLHIIKRETFRFGIHWDFWNYQSVRLTLFLPDDYAGSLQLETADGDIRMDNVAASSAVISASDGNIHISRSQFSGNADIKTFDGNIRVEAIEVTNLTMQTNDGNIFFDRPVIGGELACRAFDGNIDGTLIGSAADYTLTVAVADGNSNITSGGAGATHCDIKTLDGDVSIFFKKD